MTDEKRYRDATTGEYVSASEAESNPGGTVAETVPRLDAEDRNRAATLADNLSERYGVPFFRDVSMQGRPTYVLSLTLQDAERLLGQ